MTYPNICPAVFRSRPNRFIAEVDIDSEPETVHVKNTGRCKELLTPGAMVYLVQSNNELRKTRYDLVSVQKGGRLINMDSQAPNMVFLEYLKSGRYIKDVTLIRPEAVYGCSRFDFYLETAERKMFIEVKGVTLEENDVVLFPDAPTLRGVKHLEELARCVRDGYEAHVVFVVQMSHVCYFTPNRVTHPRFGEALAAAKDAGVMVSAFDCDVSPGSLSIRGQVHIRLG